MLIMIYYIHDNIVNIVKSRPFPRWSNMLPVKPTGSVSYAHTEGLKANACNITVGFM